LLKNQYYFSMVLKDNLYINQGMYTHSKICPLPKPRTTHDLAKRALQAFPQQRGHPPPLHTPPTFTPLKRPRTQLDL